ncbi:nicotinate-nucleotide--dimethylbenzimidazole phosphoribosyltransferase [Jiangella aurantiaca]|uniref:nicotinate-nucleotide--dimethylbenzimidazole phosphoribosyltransferase n=1 Tax=Jiangella aurantiaca TaxID=2530373 RepID=UPI00193CE860|nr:nicotinate-nucleotide--dimethylbenzimidazole phosphoribosyltransferase [Jiangella aurantiaca]
MTPTVEELIGSVLQVDHAAFERARERHAGLAKPPGSLGRLEDLGARLAAISGRCPPPVPSSPAVVVAAADHGVHAQGVSDWPQEVTAAMVATAASGGAAVNAIARTVGARVVVVDVGTLRLGPVPDGVRDERVRSATRDLAVEPAMTLEECRTAIRAGARVAAELIDGGTDLLVTGEVGIGNTTASAALFAAFTGADPSDVTGKGANLDHGRTPLKVEVVRTALARHATDAAAGAQGPLATLASLGGLEHAALVGVMLAGAAARIPVVIDGVVTGAAALAAVALCPDLAGYLVAGHTSAEPGGRTLPDRVGEPALLDLRLRLGEGTGALLAVPLVQAAARVLTEMATLADVTKDAG